MSGQRHHFLPRFLQRGFIDPSVGGEKIWLYTKDKKPFRTNIANVGVEGDFYTRSDGVSADDPITKVEDEFSRLVHELRSCSVGKVDYEEIPKLLSHLEARSQSIRNAYIEATGHLQKRFFEFIKSGAPFLHFIKRHLKKDPKLLTATIQKLQHDPEKQKQIENFIHDHLDLFLRQVEQDLPTLSESWGSELQGELKRAAKEGQIDALLAGVVPRLRTERLGGLSFSVYESKDAQFILGDSAVFFLLENSMTPTPFLNKEGRINVAILPLSSSRILVGSAHDITFDCKRVLQDVVHCSSKFFVASRTESVYESLQPEIGFTAQPLSQAHLEEIAEKMLSD